MAPPPTNTVSAAAKRGGLSILRPPSPCPHHAPGGDIRETGSTPSAPSAERVPLRFSFGPRTVRLPSAQEPPLRGGWPPARARGRGLFFCGRKNQEPPQNRGVCGEEEEGTEQSGDLAVRRGRSFFRRRGSKGPAIFPAESPLRRERRNKRRGRARTSGPPALWFYMAFRHSGGWSRPASSIYTIPARRMAAFCPAAAFAAKPPPGAGGRIRSFS